MKEFSINSIILLVLHSFERLKVFEYDNCSNLLNDSLALIIKVIHKNVSQYCD